MDLDASEKLSLIAAVDAGADVVEIEQPVDNSIHAFGKFTWSSYPCLSSVSAR